MGSWFCLDTTYKNFTFVENAHLFCSRGIVRPLRPPPPGYGFANLITSVEFYTVLNGRSSELHMGFETWFRVTIYYNLSDNKQSSESLTTADILASCGHSLSLLSSPTTWTAMSIISPIIISSYIFCYTCDCHFLKTNFNAAVIIRTREWLIKPWIAYILAYRFKICI